MKIHGLQKMTLLDFPGHVACTVFLTGCDFRCPFCHNFELAENKAEPVTDDQEFLAFLSKRQGLLDGVAFTGGEPLLHKGLPELMRKIRDMGFAVKLDTNGYHPDELQNVIDEGIVDYVAMDIKNSPEKYALTCGVSYVEMGRIRRSIDILMEAGGTGNDNAGTGDPGKAEPGVGFDYEFRTTVVDELHEARDFEKMGKMIQGAHNYFLQAFTDRDTVPYGNLHAPDAGKMRKYAEIAGFFVSRAELRGTE